MSDKIDFNVKEIDDLEFKFKHLGSLSVKELVKVPADQQVLGCCMDKGASPFYNVLCVMAPKAWFKDKNDFLERVGGDLRPYLDMWLDKIYANYMYTLSSLFAHMTKDMFRAYVCAASMQYEIDAVDENTPVDFLKLEALRSFMTISTMVKMQDPAKAASVRSQIMEGTMSFVNPDNNKDNSNRSVPTYVFAIHLDNAMNINVERALNQDEREAWDDEVCVVADTIEAKLKADGAIIENKGSNEGNAE